LNVAVLAQTRELNIDAASQTRRKDGIPLGDTRSFVRAPECLDPRLNADPPNGGIGCDKVRSGGREFSSERRTDGDYREKAGRGSPE